MPDTRFLVPKCHIYFKFSSACAYLSARACNLNNLAVYALRDQLVEFNYTATTAGSQPSLVRNQPNNKGNYLITAHKVFLFLSRTNSALSKAFVTTFGF